MTRALQGMSSNCEPVPPGSRASDPPARRPWRRRDRRARTGGAPISGEPL